ncbi:MAG: DUF58 domain-containing protein, partial [Candidatus Omnitrophica bacterium]|nr:DUF58 domain-containing protein [Candidatus Omnitrophota bacterium]
PNILRDCPLGIELQELDQETISSYCAALHTAENDFYDVEAASSAREDLRFKAIQAIRDNYESFKLNWPVVGKEATAERNRIIRRNRINERLSNIFQGQGRRYRPEGEISRPDPLMTALGEQVIDAVEKLGAAEEYLARGGATLGEGDRLDILRLLVSIRTQIDTRREELAKMRAGLNRPVAAVEIDGGRTIEDMWATLLAELGKDAIFWAFIVGLLYYLTGERARRADLPFIPVVIKDGRPRLTTQGRKLFDKVLGNMEEGPAKEHIIALFTEIMAVQEGLLSDTQKERMDSMRAALPIRERVTHDLLSCVLFEPPQQGRNRYVRLLNIMPFAVVSQLHSPKQQRLRSAHSKELEQLLEDMHENNLTFMEFHRRLYDIAQRHCLEVDGESRKVEPASASDVEERLRSAYKDIPAVQVGPAASYSTKADGWPLSIRGQSGDYLDTRPYVSGDDLRRADWKAYGRTDRLSVKQTDEDRKNMMHILVDMGTAFEAEDTDKWMLDTARSLIAVLDQSRVFGKKAYTLDRLVFIMPDPDDEPVVINVEAMRTKGFDTLLRLLIAQHEEAKERADGIPGRQLTPRAYLVKDKNGELVEVVTDKKGKEHATRYRETEQGRRYRQRTEGVFEVSTLERIERQLAKINGHLAVSGAKQALCVGIEEDAISGASDLLAERGIRSLYWNDKSQALPAEIYLAEEAQAQEAVAVSPDTQKASASGIPTGEFKAIDPALVAPFDGMLERAEELGISLPTLRAQVKNLHTGQGEEITITAYRREPHYELLGGDDKSSGGDYGAPLKKTRNIGIMLDDSLLLVAESKDGAEGIIRFSPVLEQERVAKIFTEYDGQAPEQVLLLTGMEVAPDNQFGADSRRLKGIGTLLVAAAIESSIDSSVIREDQKGNIIATNVGRLSASIEDPHGFYERIGMVPIGNDTYYFSDERAMEFLNRVRADHALEIASKAASAGLNSIKLKYPQHIDLIDELAKDDLFGEDLLLVVSRESSGDFKNTLDHISGNWEGFKATFSQLARPDSIGIEILREVFRNRPGAFAGALSRISSNWERFSTTFNQLAQPDSIGIETLREVFRNSPGAFADALNSISSNWERFSTTFNQLAHPDSIGIDALREAFRDSPNGFVGALNSIPNNWDIFNQLAQPGSIGIDVLREAFRSDSRGFENALNSISRDWERFNKLVQPELLGINILRVIFRYYAASLANLDAIGSICEQLKSEEEYLLAFPETEEAFKEFDTEGLSMGPRTYVKLLIYDRLAQDRAMPANFRTQLQEEVIPALRIIDRTFDGYPTLGMQQQDGWKKDDRENMMFALLQVIMGNFLSSAEFPRQISRSTWGAINNTCRVNIPATAYPIFGLLAQELHRMKWLKPGKPYVVNVAGDHLKEAAFLIPCLFFASLPVGQISSMPEDLPVQPKGYTFYLVESVIPARSGDSGAKSMRTNFFHSFMALVNSDYGAANDIVLLEDLERAFLLTTAAAAFLRTYGIEDSELSQLYTDFKEDIEAFLKERARMSEEEVQRLFRKAQAAQRDVIGVDLSQMRDALRQIGRFFREDLGEGAINYGIFRQKIEQFTQRVQGHLFPADESAGIIIDAAKTRDWQTIIDIAPSGGAPKAASSGLDEIKAKFPDYAELIDELSRDDSLGEDTVIEASGNDLFYRGLIMIAANRDGLSTAKDGFRTALNRLKAPEYFGIDMLRQVFVDSPFGFAIAINSISAEWEIFNQLAAPEYFGIDMLRQWFVDSPLLFGRNLYSIGEDWGQFSIALSYCRESDSLDIEIFGQAFGGDLFDCSRVLRVVAENWENFLQLEKGLGSEVSKVLFRYHQGSLANLLLILEQLKQKKDYILAFAKAEEIFEEFNVEDLSIGAQSYVKLL